MCPICIGAAALATMAGGGSAGGLAALVAVKLHIERRKKEDVACSKTAKPARQIRKSEDGK